MTVATAVPQAPSDDKRWRIVETACAGSASGPTP
jgi:hypothetical protein